MAGLSADLYKVTHGGEFRLNPPAIMGAMKAGTETEQTDEQCDDNHKCHTGRPSLAWRKRAMPCFALVYSG